MLVLSRREQESVVIDLTGDNTDGAVQEMTLGELFAQGPIVITVLSCGNSFIRLGIKAPLCLRIVRSELLDRS